LEIKAKFIELRARDTEILKEAWGESEGK